jgi:SSS family solute:Na+ symporter
VGYFSTADAAEVQANPDKIFPYFVGQASAGHVGLVIAAILAASLSSIDSAINSMTSVAMIDFVHCFSRRPTRPEELSERESRRRVARAC